MTSVTEIAPDVYRISTYNDNYKLQFNQFLVKDEEPLTESDVIGKARKAMVDFQSTRLLNTIPYTANTERLMRELGDLKPGTLAIMHGSSFRGDGEKALLDISAVMKEIYNRDS